MRWNGILSSSFAVTCGVRQGGILSPILFNVYVDDLIVLLRNKFIFVILVAVFNTKKTTCSVVGNVRHNDVLLF